jgi:Fe-S-cluster-containing dehydrogenase component
MTNAPMTRREALRKALALSSGVFFYGIAVKAATAATAGSKPAAKKASGVLAALFPDGYDPSLHYYGYGIDVDKCIGCTRCVDACKTENNVSRTEPYFRTWVERYVIRKDGEVEVSSPNGGLDPYPAVEKPETVAKSFFLPKMCGHCERSPCEQVCPVGASLRTPDGVVLIDAPYCIGCGYCVQACPYGCRYFDEGTHTAGKCTLCYHRITRGLRPACATVCPTGARIFGDLRDQDGPLVKFIRDHKVQVLKPHMGTRPKLYYHNLDKEVR